MRKKEAGTRIKQKIEHTRDTRSRYTQVELGRVKWFWKCTANADQIFEGWAVATYAAETNQLCSIEN